MRILFITDFFPPETNAAASRVFERARYWVRWGHEVTVVTSAPNFPIGEVYPGYRNRWHQVEDMDGIRVVRVKTLIAENRGKWLRSVDILSFLFTALPAALVQSRPDVVMATSPNFFAGVAGCIAAILRRVPFVLEIGDLWPAFAVSLGGINRSLAVKLLEHLELFMYRHAMRIVALSPGFKIHMVARGVPADKIEVVLNGVDLDLFTPGPVDQKLASRYNPDHRLLIGYFGTQGLAHGLESIIVAAEMRPKIRFLFVGNGAAKRSLQSMVTERGMRNVEFLDAQPRMLVPELLKLCDVALVQLRDLPLLSSAIPSKIFEAMSVGRPILLAAPDGDAADLVVQERCGLHVPAGDPPAIAAALDRLASDADLRKNLGESGCKASKSYSREKQARRMIDVADVALMNSHLQKH